MLIRAVLLALLVEVVELLKALPIGLEPEFPVLVFRYSLWLECVLCNELFVHLALLSCPPSLLQRVIIVQSVEWAGHVFALVAAWCARYYLARWRASCDTAHARLRKRLCHL